MKWKPIEDLPPNWQSLSDGELVPLLQFWNDQRVSLESEGTLAGFTDRLNREWAIETGQIEGVYNLDRGVTQMLIERGIRDDLIPRTPGQRPPEVVAAIINDHADVLDGLFQAIKGERPLTRGYINELHAALLQHHETATAKDQFGRTFESDLTKGRYKQYPSNPTRPDGSIHEYCPPEHVDAEMDRLIEMHAAHANLNVPVEVEAAWLHHRFTQIHPYQDGNGRVARALATLCFVKSGWFALVVSRDDRARYLDALELADAGNLRGLVEFFVDVQRRSLFQATQAAADTRQSETIEEALANARQVIKARALDPSVWIKSKPTAQYLMGIARDILGELKEKLASEMRAFAPRLYVRHMLLAKGNFLGEHLGYVPNLNDMDDGTVLELTGLGTAFLRVNAHAIGSKYRGLIGIVVTFGLTDDTAVLASPDVFQVNYVESEAAAEARFRPWLERSLAHAIDLWRKTL